MSVDKRAMIPLIWKVQDLLRKPQGILHPLSAPSFSARRLGSISPTKLSMRFSEEGIIRREVLEFLQQPTPENLKKRVGAGENVDLEPPVDVPIVPAPGGSQHKNKTDVGLSVLLFYIEKLEKRMQTLRDALTAQERTQMNNEREITRLQQELEALEAENQRLQQYAFGMRGLCEQAQRETKTVEEVRRTAEEELGQVKEKLQRTKRERDRLGRQKAHQAQAFSKEKKEAVEAMQAQRDDARTAQQAAETARDQARAEREAMRGERDAERAERAARDATIADLRLVADRVPGLEVTIRDLRAENKEQAERIRLLEQQNTAATAAIEVMRGERDSARTQQQAAVRQRDAAVLAQASAETERDRYKRQIEASHGRK